ncbi:hypothetical protein [Chryseobacterium scophthalmum]|uniref:hypothetical protein n=1 Tax=Chryseobacterium scophthalmum TaxID=59733 RepID=UPI001AEBBD2D|nr:hypothetical protein [Chryseobacterium scophthalmum]
MSRTRIVKGKYTKAVGGNYNILAEGNVFSSAGGQVQEKGFDNGVSYGSFERIGSNVNEDFEISFSLSKDKMYSTVVPFGILDFEGNYENANFAFNYSLLLSNVDSLEFKILNEDGTTLFAITNLPEIVVTARRLPKLSQDITDKKPEYNLSNPIRVWDWKSVFDPYNTSSSDYTKIGSYVIFWDGFDNDNIYDSSKFNNKKLKAVITASKNGKEKSKEVEFSTKYNEVEWVDVKIDKNNKKIDTTLRVNLKDGGAEGLKCSSHLAGVRDEVRWVESCPWDKIPTTSIIAGKPPIKIRTRSFTDLEKLAIDGLNYHWGRNKNHAAAKDVKIVGESYEVFTNAINTQDNAMDDVDLMYNTNYFWGRSNNPGCVSGFKSFLANIAQYVPYVPLSETIYYNVGYVNNVYKAESHFLFKESWFYIDDVPLYKNGKSKVDMEYSYTCAHEIGHTILRAFSEHGGGSADYSYEHKGSSGYSDTKPVSEGGVSYPTHGEIDVMKYFNNTPYFLNYDFERIVAEDKDILGLIWLTKLKIK